jgi:hypothetical protein
VTRPRGRTALVLPALDGLAHLLALNHRREHTNPPVTLIDQGNGIVEDEVGLPQKYYLPDEISTLLSTHGFRDISIQRITYPWRMMRAFGWGYFPSKPRTWDWYVEAVRSSARLPA